MKSGLTILELIITVVIIAIIGGLSFISWQGQLENEYAYNAKAFLNASWQAEQTYYSWKNTYTANWSQLEIKNPNTADNFYDYSISHADAVSLLITATRKNKSKVFSINENGLISEGPID